MRDEHGNYIVDYNAGPHGFPKSESMIDSIVPEFRKFQKIPRWSRDIVVTEKIDGTNGLVYISPDMEIVRAGSRSQWIYPGKKDNCGFAAWVEQHRGELLSMGPGYHYGEWWGSHINRNYGLNEKRWSVFNTTRWKPGVPTKPDYEGKVYELAVCARVVPILYEGPLDELAILDCLNALKLMGSRAAPGFMNPEGVVVFHTAGNYYFKKTILDDDKPKGEQEA
jgi:hypothetical protein